jgi:hypothetical protein
LKKYSDPWEHIVVDNYYDTALLKSAQEELIDYIKSGVELHSMNYINDLAIFPATKRCVDSHPVTDSWLKDFKEFRSYNNLTIRNQIIICIGEASYNIHYENPTKILSAVTYLWSNNGTGTVLYDVNKNFVKEVEWVPNRLLLFCGKDNVTWHSYYSKPKSVRITLNTFLEQL